MTERENVIKALNDALAAKENYPLAKAEMSFDFIRMILSLLKEQEEVEPVTERHLFLCPVCKNTLFREQKFCHECGHGVKWE